MSSRTVPSSAQSPRFGRLRAGAPRSLLPSDWSPRCSGRWRRSRSIRGPATVGSAGRRSSARTRGRTGTRLRNHAIRRVATGCSSQEWWHSSASDSQPACSCSGGSRLGPDGNRAILDPAGGEPVTAIGIHPPSLLGKSKLSGHLGGGKPVTAIGIHRSPRRGRHLGGNRGRLARRWTGRRQPPG
jgi:hypothetical protein